MRSQLRHMGRLLTWAPVVVLFSDTICTVQYMEDTSMEPRVPQGTLAVVTRSIRTRDLLRGEVLRLNEPDTNAQLIRRLVGLPGDLVRTRTGNNLVALPNGFVWVETDNPNVQGAHSRDSNHFGPVPVALINGRVRSALPHGPVEKVSAHPRVFPHERSGTWNSEP